MRRFFTEPQNICGDTAYIFEDAAHITKVLRMELGDEVLIFDGSGYEYTSKLTEVNRERCTAEILSKEFSAQEPQTKVTVFQGIPKSGKMDSIIQKSVELGVYSIVPVVMDRCVSKLDKKAATEKPKRWNKIAQEAAKQCGRGILPKVEEPIDFKDAVKRMSQLELALMPYEMLGHSGVSNLKEVLKSNPAKEIGIIIGPEGGISDSEAQLAMDGGIKAVGLGKRILRTETVSGAMLAMIMYENDEI